MKTTIFSLGTFAFLSLPCLAGVTPYGSCGALITQAVVENGVLKEVVDEKGNPIELFRVERPGVKILDNGDFTLVESKAIFHHPGIKLFVNSFEIHGYFIRVTLNIVDPDLPLLLSVPAFEYYAYGDNDRAAADQRVLKAKELLPKLVGQVFEVPITAKETLRYEEAPRPYTWTGPYDETHEPAKTKLQMYLRLELELPGLADFSFWNGSNLSIPQWQRVHGCGKWDRVD